MKDLLKWWPALGLLVICCGGLAAQDDAGVASDPPASAKERLRSAKQLVSALKGLEGEERVAAIDRAIAAYRQVIETDAENSGACARAWYESAELMRRKADLEAAEGAYRRAAELDPGQFAVRGAMGQAEMLRRRSDLPGALAKYREVVKLEPDSARAHKARVWIGSCLRQSGDPEAAIAAYRTALDATSKPRRIIELCNKLAQTQIAEGDLEGAAATIGRADDAVPESGDDRERIAKAALAMSARRALQRARDKANGAADDAQRLERDTRSRG